MILNPLQTWSHCEQNQTIMSYSSQYFDKRKASTIMEVAVFCQESANYLSTEFESACLSNSGGMVIHCKISV